MGRPRSIVERKCCVHSWPVLLLAVWERGSPRAEDVMTGFLRFEVLSAAGAFLTAYRAADLDLAIKYAVMVGGTVVDLRKVSR
jgi:hypothetical protein